MASRRSRPNRLSVNLQQDPAIMQQLFGKTIVKPVHGRRSSLPKLECYEAYKNIEKLVQKAEIHKSETTPLIEVLSKAHESHLKPLTLGLMSPKEKKIKLKERALSERYVTIFSSGLRKHKAVEAINLQGNRLSDNGSASILSSIQSPHIRKLNLSENRLGPHSVKSLLPLLTANNCELTHLNLESTGLTTPSLEALAKALETNTSVSHLNLAKNSLRGPAVVALGKMLLTNSGIHTLDLYWNMCNGAGAQALFEGLTGNKTLRELDLSWNSLGTGAKHTILAVSECVKVNIGLRHLDISYNSLNSEHCQVLSEAFLENHSIMGMHVMGNNCSVDSFGFLHVHAVSGVCQPSQRRILVGRKAEELCWICEQWTEVNLSFPVDHSGPLFFHCEVDEYKPVMLTKGPDCFTLKRMFPSRPVKSFCTDLSGNVYLSGSYPVQKVEVQIKIDYTPSYQVTVLLDSVNLLQATGKSIDLEDPIEILPRVESYSAQILIIPDPVESQFSERRNQSPEFSERCFEHEWAQTSVEHLFPTQVDYLKCKEHARGLYPLVRKTCKALSVYGDSNVLHVDFRILQKFFTDNRVFDRLYPESQLEKSWAEVKACSGSAENVLVVAEFLGLLVRIAHEKYFKTGVKKTVVKSFVHFMREIKLPMNRTHNQ